MQVLGIVRLVFNHLGGCHIFVAALQNSVSQMRPSAPSVQFQLLTFGATHIFCHPRLITWARPSTSDCRDIVTRLRLLASGTHRFMRDVFFSSGSVRKACGANMPSFERCRHYRRNLYQAHPRKFNPTPQQKTSEFFSHERQLAVNQQKKKLCLSFIHKPRQTKVTRIITGSKGIENYENWKVVGNDVLPSEQRLGVPSGRIKIRTLLYERNGNCILLALASHYAESECSSLTSE
ncbi:hypothetical protein BC830DRAFT_366083 [Chytriomyces sp. MP71]|nr:hypothetical protein BC830DRAFT_366083 [Chytriomyces sp. MP71]